MGDEALLDSKRAPLPSRSLLSAGWMGPFKARARTALSPYRMDLFHVAWHIFNEFEVERLRPYLRRPAGPGGAV